MAKNAKIERNMANRGKSGQNGAKCGKSRGKNDFYVIYIPLKHSVSKVIKEKVS